MADRVKVYEEAQKKGLSIWAWLLPLLLLLALLIYFLTRHPASTNTAAAPATVATPANGTPQLGAVRFNTDQATLTPDDEATLKTAAAFMKSNPNAHLRLEGYTDSTGSTPHNASLSEQRASTVANFLKAQGVDSSRLTGQGFGPANPADTNGTAAGKADNRRVELFTQQ